MNPLDWDGPDFLGMYVPVLLFFVLAAALLRHALRFPGPTSDMTLPHIGPYEAALLRGRTALVEAALASLSHQGLIRMEVNRLVTSGRPQLTAPLIERIVHASVMADEVKPAELVRKAEPAIAQLRAPLVRRGWLLDDAAALRVRWLPALPVLALFLLGIAKVVVGLGRDKPVGILVALCFAGVLVFPWLTLAPWRTRRGDAVLQALCMEQAPLRQTAKESATESTMASEDAAMAVGLFGLTALAATDFEPLRRHLETSGYSSYSTGFSADGVGSSFGGDGGGAVSYTHL
ncbi:TIGR04222 domain-containing membrane protein, partial [Pyxidicoccus fallax]|uniref:TIGR04222 domain-containing membrane protein n=1 Tax=Pyxidicoccus fallax TaxID=394095 RepID=UPI001493FA1F